MKNRLIIKIISGKYFNFSKIDGLVPSARAGAAGSTNSTTGSTFFFLWREAPKKSISWKRVSRIFVREVWIRANAKDNAKYFRFFRFSHGLQWYSRQKSLVQISVEKKTYFPYVFFFDTFFFGKSCVREIIDFIAFSDVFWLSKHDPAIILSKITDLDSFRCCVRSFHERPKKSQKIGGWKWSKYPYNIIQNDYYFSFQNDFSNFKSKWPIFAS